MAAHGISLDFPFLTDDVLDFAISLPSKVKYGVRSKPLLRQTMRRMLPARIRLRARHGFTVPQSGPALRVIDNAAREIMSQERVESAGLFRWPFVANILATAGHNVYRRRQFWALLMFFAWYREFMEA
jgi:asparagine synthetase B (glutamine-hydrolysing)